MELLSHPLGVAHFALLCAASALFLHQTGINVLLLLERPSPRHRAYVVLSASSAVYALLNVAGFLPVPVPWKVQILQLQWACAIWIAATYIRAIQAFLGSDSRPLRVLGRWIAGFALLPLSAVGLYALSGRTFFYSLTPRPSASLIWNATGNVVTHNWVTDLWGAVDVACMALMLVLVLREVLRTPRPDRFLVVGVCVSAVAAAAEPSAGALGWRYGLPLFYLANAIEVLRIAYVSTREAGSARALLEREGAAQRGVIAHQMRLLESPAKWMTVGQMTGGIGHEMRGPLAAAKSWVQLARDRLERGVGELAVPLSRAEAALAHLGEILHALGTVSREPATEAIQDVPVSRVVDQAMSLCEPAIKRAECESEVRIEPGLRVRGRPTELVQLLINLIVNACDAVEGLQRRHLRIDAERDGRDARLRVTDSGPRPSPGVRRRMFEPFYTTKSSGEGTGIGLTLCRQIAERLGGAVTLDGEAASTSFVVRLPQPALVPSRESSAVAISDFAGEEAHASRETGE